MKKIVIIGASGHAKVIIDIINKQNTHNIVGLVDITEKIGSKIMGHSILGTENTILQLVNKYKDIEGIIAIGDNWLRNKVLIRIQKMIPTFPFAKVIHPNAVIAKNVTIGEGTVIMPGAIVNSEATIGSFCILNTNSSLDHDSIMQNFSSLAPGATIGGNVRIGCYSAISLGAKIIHGVEIGEHTIIGAGAVVVKPIPAKVIAYGIPARIMHMRNEGEKYL